MQQKRNLSVELLNTLFNGADFLWEKATGFCEILRFLLPSYSPGAIESISHEGISVLWSGVNPQEVNFDKDGALASFCFWKNGD